MTDRIGVCGGCGTRFKVPATFQGHQATCKKCGGTVTVGDAPAAAAPPPAARPAPAKPSAAGKPAPRPIAPKAAAPAPAAAAAPTKAAAGRASAAGGRGKTGRASGASRKAAPPKSNTPLIAGGIVVAIAIAAGAYFMMGGEDATEIPVATAGSDATATTPAAPTNVPEVVLPPTPEVAVTPEPVDVVPTPEPVTPKEPEVVEELPSVIAIEPFARPDNCSEDQWQALVEAVSVGYIEPSRPAKAKEAKMKLPEHRVAAISAMVNALNGLDLADEKGSRTAYGLIDGVQQLSLDDIKVPYKLDLASIEETVQWNAKVVQNLRNFWAKKVADPEAYAATLVAREADMKAQGEDFGQDN
jgi:hypothetical protein